ncbi:RNase H domain-containing protein, partial [Durusdinium trenchii]
EAVIEDQIGLFQMQIIHSSVYHRDGEIDIVLPFDRFQNDRENRALQEAFRNNLQTRLLRVTKVLYFELMQREARAFQAVFGRWPDIVLHTVDDDRVCEQEVFLDNDFIFEHNELVVNLRLSIWGRISIYQKLWFWPVDPDVTPYEYHGEDSIHLLIASYNDFTTAPVMFVITNFGPRHETLERRPTRVATPVDKMYLLRFLQYDEYCSRPLVECICRIGGLYVSDQLVHLGDGTKINLDVRLLEDAEMAVSDSQMNCSASDDIDSISDDVDDDEVVFMQVLPASLPFRVVVYQRGRAAITHRQAQLTLMAERRILLANIVGFTTTDPLYEQFQHHSVIPLPFELAYGDAEVFIVERPHDCLPAHSIVLADIGYTLGVSSRIWPWVRFVECIPRRVQRSTLLVGLHIYDLCTETGTDRCQVTVVGMPWHMDDLNFRYILPGSFIEVIIHLLPSPIPVNVRLALPEGVMQPATCPAPADASFMMQTARPQMRGRVPFRVEEVVFDRHLAQDFDIVAAMLKAQKRLPTRQTFSIDTWAMVNDRAWIARSPKRLVGQPRRSLATAFFKEWFADEPPLHELWTAALFEPLPPPLRLRVEPVDLVMAKQSRREAGHRFMLVDYVFVGSVTRALICLQEETPARRLGFLFDASRSLGANMEWVFRWTREHSEEIWQGDQFITAPHGAFLVATMEEQIDSQCDSDLSDFVSGQSAVEAIPAIHDRHAASGRNTASPALPDMVQDETTLMQTQATIVDRITQYFRQLPSAQVHGAIWVHPSEESHTAAQHRSTHLFDGHFDLHKQLTHFCWGLGVTGEYRYVLVDPPPTFSGTVRPAIIVIPGRNDWVALLFRLLDGDQSTTGTVLIAPDWAPYSVQSLFRLAHPHHHCEDREVLCFAFLEHQRYAYHHDILLYEGAFVQLTVFRFEEDELSTECVDTEAEVSSDFSGSSMIDYDETLAQLEDESSWQADAPELLFLQQGHVLCKQPCGASLRTDDIVWNDGSALRRSADIGELYPNAEYAHFPTAHLCPPDIGELYPRVWREDAGEFCQLIVEGLESDIWFSAQENFHSFAIEHSIASTHSPPDIGEFYPRVWRGVWRGVRLKFSWNGPPRYLLEQGLPAARCDMMWSSVPFWRVPCVVYLPPPGNTQKTIWLPLQLNTLDDIHFFPDLIVVRDLQEVPKRVLQLESLLNLQQAAPREGRREDDMPLPDLSAVYSSIMSCYQQEWPDLSAVEEDLPIPTLQFFDSVAYGQMSDCESLLIFTDGSFYHDATEANGWAFVVIGQKSLGGQIAIHAAWGPTCTDQYEPQWTGALKPSSKVGEVDALIHAIAWRVASQFQGIVTFCFDAQASGYATAGMWSCNPGDRQTSFGYGLPRTSCHAENCQRLGFHFSFQLLFLNIIVARQERGDEVVPLTGRAARSFGLQLHQTKNLLRKRLRGDRTDFLCSIAQEAIEGPPSLLHKRLRAIGIAGRKFQRGPQPLPRLVQDDGTVIDSFESWTESWRAFFAQQEDGIVVSPEELLTTCQQREPHCICEWGDLPTLTEMEHAMRRTRFGTAFFEDGVPADVLHVGAQHLARRCFPLLLKHFAMGVEPVLFKGGTLVQAYKGKGPSDRHDSYRSLLISSTIGKIHHRLIRQRLTKYFEPYALPLQLGGLPCKSVTQASHVVHLFLDQAWCKGYSTAIIFVDIQQAFYRVLRQHAICSLRDMRGIKELFATMRLDDTAYDDFVAYSQAATALDEAGVSPHLQSLMADAMDGTWFVVKGLNTLTQTRKGTRPGDSFADILFAYSFARLLRGMTVHMKAQGLLLEIAWSGKHEPVADSRCHTQETLGPIWADDLTVMIQHESPLRLLQATSVVAGELLDRLSVAGMTPNLNRGKTEVMVSLRGKRSVALRRTIAKDGNSLTTTSRFVQRPLHVTGAYRHLGVWLHMNGSPWQDIRVRFAMAHSKITQYRSSLFGNKAMPLDKKVQLLDSLVLSAVHYNLIVWVPFRKNAQQAYERKFSGLIRRVAFMHFGLTVKEWTADELFAYLGVAPPAVQMHVHRLRYLQHLISSAILQTDSLDDALNLLKESTSKTTLHQDEVEHLYQQWSLWHNDCDMKGCTWQELGEVFRLCFSFEWFHPASGGHEVPVKRDLQEFLERIVIEPHEVKVLSVDIVFSEELGNLAKPAVYSKFRDAFQCGLLVAAGCGPPCESWSRARLHGAQDGGPMTLRSAAHLQGLPALQLKEFGQVAIGNDLLGIAINLAIVALIAGAYFFLEHPKCPPETEAASI